MFGQILCCYAVVDSAGPGSREFVLEVTAYSYMTTEHAGGIPAGVPLPLSK